MAVAPGGGGGNTVLNLIEPRPAGSEVFYATPVVDFRHPLYDPFPQLSPYICWFSGSSGRTLPYLRGARVSKTIRHFNKVIARVNSRIQEKRAVRQLTRYIRELGIDALLVCPQGGMFDLTVAVELMERAGLPTVAWFMDNYYTDRSSISYVRKIWDKAQHRFVISEAMQQHFTEVYGEDCEVLNNSVSFPELSHKHPVKTDSPLRIAYTGAINSYYEDVMSLVLAEFRELNSEVVFDIYSHDKIPSGFQSVTDAPWRQFAPIPSSELVGRLREYDVLLLLSSFNPEHRAIAETSLASKTTDYLAAGRCILAYGPEYSENVGYAKRHGFGEVATSPTPGALKESVLSLKKRPERLRELGERAYNFGQSRHDRVTNSTRLWRALAQACDAAKTN